MAFFEVVRSLCVKVKWAYERCNEVGGEIYLIYARVLTVSDLQPSLTAVNITCRAEETHRSADERNNSHLINVGNIK